MDSGMDDKIKGKIHDIKGRIKRKAGERTEHKDLQAKGTGDRVRGKAQQVVGSVKDALRDGVNVDDRVERRRKHDLDKGRDLDQNLDRGKLDREKKDAA
jgi:uncharacterized protein YjbJ (UPF0337 family)